MRANDPGHQRIKPPHQLASCFVVVLKRSFNQSACVRIIHVIESASTPIHMTVVAALWLQLLVWRCSCQASVGFDARRGENCCNRGGKFCNRCSLRAVMSFQSAKKRFQTRNETY